MSRRGWHRGLATDHRRAERHTRDDGGNRHRHTSSQRAHVGASYHEGSAAARRCYTLCAMSSRTRHGLILAGILAAAWLLRASHLRAGVPYAVGVDEPQIMERVVRMMKTADFNPHFFDWPSLTTYLQLVVACATFLFGAMRGAWNNLDQVSAANFYVAARGLTAALGAGTVLLTYLAGRRWGVVTGLIAAGLMAVMPSHVRESHYVLTDVPTAFFTTLGFLLALRAIERPSTGAFVWAGVAAGLAASCKYNGATVVLLPLAAIVMTGGGPAVIARRLALVCVAAFAAFVVGTPYAVLDLPSFLNDYARLAAIFARPRGGEPGWSIYLKYLEGSLGVAGFWLAGLGVLIAILRVARGPERGRWFLLLLFPVVYFEVMAHSAQIYGRYILPLLPPATLLAAIAIATLARVLAALPMPRALALAGAAALVVVATVEPARTAISFDRNLGRPGTIDLTYRWIQGHLDPGTKIVVETHALLLPAPRYVSENVAAIVAKRAEDYRAEGVSYLVASTDGYEAAFAPSAAGRPELASYRALFDQTDEIASFTRSRDVDGPTLRIFKLKAAHP